MAQQHTLFLLSYLLQRDQCILCFFALCLCPTGIWFKPFLCVFSNVTFARNSPKKRLSSDLIMSPSMIPTTWHMMSPAQFTAANVNPVDFLAKLLLASIPVLVLSVSQSHCNPLIIRQFPESCGEIYKFPAACSCLVKVGIHAYIWDVSMHTLSLFLSVFYTFLH